MAKKSGFDFESWGERVSAESFSSKRGEGGEPREPVVFHFRPTEFIVVDKEHRDDWKKLFEEQVDTPIQELQHQWTGHPDETVSGCTGGGWDDCDQG